MRKKLISVVSLGQSQVLARSLLELGIEDVGVAFENVDEVLLDLWEEIDPLAI